MNDVSRICKLLMMKEPFYGFFLLNLNKSFSKELPTAGVGKQGINTQLLINEDFWNSLSDDHKLGLLQHELIHLCFFHLTSRHSYSDKKLFNIAADCELNQYIKSEWLPDGAILPSTFSTLTLDIKAGTNYYYHALLQNNNSDNPDPNLKSLMDGQNDPSQGGNGDMHPTWKEFDNLSDVEKKLVQNQIDHILKETATNTIKSRGLIPGELKSKIDELFKVEAPVFNWKAYLRRKLGNSKEIYTKKSRRKLSKRFEDNAGIKIKQKHHILVAIDTSGSVSNAELVEFFSEIYHIYKSGTRITIIECDTKINDIYEYKGKFKGSVIGRGGTHLDSALEYYNLNNKKFTTCVFFTDGGDNISIKVRKSIIWVMSSNASYNDSFKGKIIQIPKISNV